MEKNWIAMSRRERDVLKVMSRVIEGKRTQAEAGRLLKISARQVRRIQRRMEADGDDGLVHRLRGRPSNRRLDAAVKKQVLAIYKREYPDFGPTFAREKLDEEHGLKIGRETLRSWLLEADLWHERRRREKHRQRRERRACFGEMVQADASPHEWLEGRGEKMRLLGIIDDASSRVMLRFYPSETTEAYMDLMTRWVKKHGRPLSWYCDRHGIFVAYNEFKERVPTQFSRALEELDIELIPANSPQAKGRIERVWNTAQDRLVKEMRLARAMTMEQANAVVDATFAPWFNRKCVVKPASPNDAHRSLGREHDLAAIFSIQEKRVVANDYTIRLDNRVYQLLAPVWPGERGGTVIVEKRLDGSMRVRFNGRYLEYKGAARQVCLPGAGPQSPRSLSREPISAEGEEEVKEEGRAKKNPARPSADLRPGGRSGRTSAEPCPATGGSCGSGSKAYRPPPNHPWRGTGPKKADISIGRK
jgi:transposase